MLVMYNGPSANRRYDYTKQTYFGDSRIYLTGHTVKILVTKFQLQYIQS